MDAEVILKEATEKFEILKRNLKSLNIKEQLELASSIRDYIVNNSTVTSACEYSASLTENRKKILDGIKGFQQDLVKSIYEYVNKLDDKRITKFQFDYEFAKANLIKLLTEELACNNETDSILRSTIDIIDRHVNLAKETITICEKDEYKIVLVGEYQSGKTTTINAFCGGTHIGVIGDGRKTSSTPLIVHSADKLFFKVIWKSDNDFASIFPHIEKYVGKLNKFDITDKTARQILLEKLERIRKNISYGDMQFAVLCAIVLRYWGSEVLTKCMNNTKPTIEEINNWSKFSYQDDKDLNSRWKDRGISSIDFNEVVFVFVKEINCYCPIGIVKDLNAVIEDCPGLFAHRYDTEVTQTILKKANAILFILPREKASGEQYTDYWEREVNKYSDYEDKFVFANNINKSLKWKPIFEQNKNNLYTIFNKEVELISYDGRVAYNAYVKKYYDEGLLDEYSVEKFIGHNFDEEDEDFEECATMQEKVEYIWESCRPRKCKTADEAINYSNFNVLTQKIKSVVEANKAYSIIIENGISPLRTELVQEIKGINAGVINSYLKSESELNRQWDNIINNLIPAFESQILPIVNNTFYGNNYGRENLEDELTNAIYKKLFPKEEYDSIAESCCTNIYTKIAEIKKAKEGNERNALVNDIVSDCINSKISSRYSYWKELLDTNQDRDFETIFVPAINKMKNEFIRKWKDIFKNEKLYENSMTNYFSISHNIKSVNNENGTGVGNLSFNSDLNAGRGFKILGGAAAVVGIAGEVAGILLAASGPIGWIIGGFAVLVAGLCGWAKGEEKAEEKFRDNTLPELRKVICDEKMSKDLKKGIRTVIHGMLETYKNNLKIDKERIKRTKDVAINSKTDSSFESRCFNAVYSIEKIRLQIEQYDKFITNLKNGQA